jgi:hypothetical protein
MRWAGRAYSTNGAKANAYSIFVGKSEEKKPLGRPRRRWVNNINIDLREKVGWYALVPMEGSYEHCNE